ncbi:uncharacterized protein V6R79_018509 [Siganus canaliculatus]
MEMDNGEDLDISKINDGLGLFEGDILEEIRTQTRVRRNVILDKDGLWDIPVPYVLEDNLELNAKGTILRAFEHFRLKTCIDFRPRQSDDYYLSVRKHEGCSSYVSKLIESGQVLSIGRRCDHIGIVEHEFMHALGLFHEQSRYDRDDYITIIWKNIGHGYERNFNKVSKSITTTFNAPYDYMSVMHYGKDYFSKNGGDTIVTKLPEYQDRIGQRMEMSSIDVYKLNRLYNCNSTISFMAYCDFSGTDICGMSRCKRGLVEGWKRVRSADREPSTGFTNRNKIKVHSLDYFMHASTASGQEGDSAWLETKRMKPTRECHVQCLQFYYYHSGSESDELNIWIREFPDERSSTGSLRLMAQITGKPTYDWHFYKVPLSAAKTFQVVFEVRKGSQESSGGFSIDNINLSESECPHEVWRIHDFEKLLTTTDYDSYLFSPRMYSSEGYAYQVIIVFRETFFGVYFRLVSGEHDSRLAWPCAWRQVSIIMLDQNPHIQHQMSKQLTLTTDPSFVIFDNPEKVGMTANINGESLYVNVAYGMGSFLSLEQIKSRDFLKGGNAVFLLSFTDISDLQHKSSLPCPKRPRSKFTSTDSSDNIKPCDAK